MGPGGPGTQSQSTANASTLPGVGVTPPSLGGPPLTHIPPGAGPPQFRALIAPFVSSTVQHYMTRQCVMNSIILLLLYILQ
jgi:hypothetical protein